MDCARKYARYGHRDATMILVVYRHGLQASEVCDTDMAPDRRGPAVHDVVASESFRRGAHGPPKSEFENRAVHPSARNGY
jgi:hypothetical protein